MTKCPMTMSDSARTGSPPNEASSGVRADWGLEFVFALEMSGGPSKSMVGRIVH